MLATIKSKRRLGFTFTEQEVEVLRAACSEYANTDDGSNPPLDNSPEANAKKLAAAMGVKFLNRLGRGSKAA